MQLDKREIVAFFENLYDVEPWPGIINIDFIRITENKETGKTSRESIFRQPLVCLEQIREMDMRVWSKQQENLGNAFFTVGFVDAKAKRNFLDNIVAVSSLWADVDNVDDSKLEELLKYCPLQPTGIIRSGGGVHLYWKLDTYCFDTKKTGQVSNANLKVHAWVTGDHTHNSNRLLRLPGTFNVKPKYLTNGTLPPKSTIVRWNREVKYSIEQILNVGISYFELKVPKAFKDKWIVEGYCFNEKEHKDDRSYRDFKIAAEMFTYGHTEAEIKETLTNPAWGCSSKAGDPNVWSEYVDKTIESARQTAKTLATGFAVYDNQSKSVIIRKKVKANLAVEEEVISNFCVVPLRRITLMENGLPIDELIEARTQTNFDRQRTATIRIQDFVHPERFQSNTGIAMCSFWGEKRDFSLYIDYLSRAEIPVSVATGTVGWCDDTFIIPDRVLYGPKTDLEYIDNFGVNPQIHVVKEPFPITEDSIRTMFSHVRNLHMSSVSILTWGWMLASAFAQRIRSSYYQQFPLLCLHGQPGSGKTTLARTYINNLFGYLDELSGGGSKAGVRNTLASLNSIPVLIDEFDAGELDKNNIHMILRALWQAGYVPRMKMGGKVELNKMKLTAPAVLTTMIGITDDAVQDRAINLRLNKIDFNAAIKHKEWFETLPKGGFLNEWITQDPIWIAKIGEIGKTIPTSPRQQHSFGTVAAVLQYIGTKYNIPELNITNFVAWWGGHSETPISPMSVIDQLLSYLIRSLTATLLPNVGFKVEGTVLSVSSAAFVDAAVSNCDKLKLNVPVDRKWLLETLKDAQKSGEVIARDRQCWFHGKNIRCVVFDVNAMPLTKEVVCE